MYRTRAKIVSGILSNKCLHSLLRGQYQCCTGIVLVQNEPVRQKYSRCQNTVSKLISLDKTHRVEPSGFYMNSVRRGVHEIIHKLVKGVSKRDPLFRGKLYPTGSAHDGTMVCSPNEFDYVLLLSNCDVFPIAVDKIVYAKQQLSCSGKLIAFPRNCVQDSLITSEEVKSRFKKWLDPVMSNVKLPGNIRHGPLNTNQCDFQRYIMQKSTYINSKDTCTWNPNMYHGYLRNSPAFLFQFVHSTISHDSCETDPNLLDICVDLIPGFQIPATDPSLKPVLDCIIPLDFVAQELYKRGFLKHLLFIPTTSGTWLCSNSLAEDRFFSTWSFESVPKKVLRVCKILTALHTKVMCDDIRMPCSMRDTRMGHGVAPRSDVVRWYMLQQEPTLHDLFTFFKSYVFRILILTMMLADDLIGQPWDNPDDIPKHVINIFEIIKRLLEESKAGRCPDGYIEYNDMYLPCPVYPHLKTQKYGEDKLLRETNKILYILRQM